ncbi:hypothetical protein Pla22_28750 [Rubripirellula amarantea]|uniref:Uncharacterized protein n=1 Tax=Rubripirellula amarantea TaxID=2527999 RepID=A0A5C5WJ51_9BACT|nr:hypothetical protein Pla22_28750 [Rubripirellula amarantea]
MRVVGIDVSFRQLPVNGRAIFGSRVRTSLSNRRIIRAGDRDRHGCFVVQIANTVVGDTIDKRHVASFTNGQVLEICTGVKRVGTIGVDNRSSLTSSAHQSKRMRITRIVVRDDECSRYLASVLGSIVRSIAGHGSVIDRIDRYVERYIGVLPTSVGCSDGDLNIARLVCGVVQRQCASSVVDCRRVQECGTRVADQTVCQFVVRMF